MNPEELLNFLVLGAAILFLLAAAGLIYAISLILAARQYWARRQAKVARDANGRPLKERI